MEYVQVAVESWGPIAPARLWQPIAGVFLVPEGSKQCFLVCGHRGDHLQVSFDLAADYGALRHLTADHLVAHATDVVYESILRSVGVQSDLGILME